MKKSTLGKISVRLRPYSPWLILTAAAAILSVAGQIMAPYFIGKAIDGLAYTVNEAGKRVIGFDDIYRQFAFMGICIAATVSGQFVLSLSNNRIAYHVLADVRREAFRKIQFLPLAYIDNRAYGDVSSVILSDAEQFSDGLLLGFTQLFTGVATILGVLAIMFVMRWEIAVVVLIVTPLSLFAAKFIASRTYKMFGAQAEARAEQTAFADEMIAGLKVVKAYTREEENEEIFDGLNETLRKKSLSALFFSSATNPVTRFVNSVVYALVALVGALLAIATAGTAAPFTAGNLTAFLSYSNQYTKPFNEISEVIAEFQNALACASRLFALIGETEEISDKGLPALGDVKGAVEVKDVSFSYAKEKKLIENMNISAGAGKRIAIVGPTGCGKTTLINLLMRFYDVDGGAIYVDGQDIRKVTRRSLRENFGMVLQETWLKTATVKENLRLGNPDASERDVINAAIAAHAHGFILRLPKGYDTVLGEGGSLSEGQKQLLCIARIMLCRPPMLILDEATSNIDTRTERAVQDAFQKLMEGRTTFVVAHRLSTIKNADLILVMKAGNIVEQGTHEELLAKNGFYSELYYAQFDSALPLAPHSVRRE